MEKFWWSAETEADVGDAYAQMMKPIAAALNQLLANVFFGERAEQWAFIAIIREKDSPGYGEIVKRSSRGKVLEFRLKIPHAEFLVASPSQRISLIFKALSRSVTLMEKLGVSPETRTKLQEVLTTVERKLQVVN